MSFQESPSKDPDQAEVLEPEPMEESEPNQKDTEDAPETGKSLSNWQLD